MLLEAENDAKAGVFYDFDYEPATLSPAILHCPCYAVEGVVIAMSMPDPPLGVATSNPQAGSRAGSIGLLLPGFFVDASADGRLTIRGPALPEEGHLLPAGAAIDALGFLSISQPSS